MSTLKHIRILKPSIDDSIEPNVIRGVLDLDTIRGLKIDHSYQRERLAAAARKEISKALETGKSLPDVELGMRGDTFDLDDEETYADLKDPVYIMDGYQRTESLKEHLERFPTDNIRLGAVVHLKTNPVYERERFQALNLFRAKVSASIMLRNYKEDVRLMAQLYGLSHSQKDPMYGKVCWSQNKSHGEILSALTYCQVSLLLHTWMGASVGSSTKDIPGSLERLEKITGLPLFRGNVVAFWEFIDFAWGARTVTKRSPAVHFKASFLHTISRVFADHLDFWQDKRLVIPAEIRKKLARLSMADPEIARLATGGGKSVETLYFQLVRHINASKKTKRITSRYGTIVPPPSMPDDDTDDEAQNVG